ncbi:hypothetical protein EDB19DRAFT_1829548 [Suillus lakei]|nr:hypothetical protein EDB19DRAFT_1829548 [Suillus lakei]
MSTTEFTAEFSNTAMGDAAEKIMNFVEKAVKLRDAFFVTVPVWANIRSDDPQIQKHPLKGKAQSITVVWSQPVVVANVAASIAGMLALVKVKPRPKPVTKRMKAAHESQESKGNETGCTREKSLLAYTSSQKGKGREVVPGEDEDEAIEVNQGQATRVQKRKGSNTSLPPIASSAMKHQVANSTAKQTKRTSKCPKVTSETVSLKDNAPKEDINAGCGTTGAKLQACSHCSQQKFKCSLAKADLVHKAKNKPTHATGPWQKRLWCLMMMPVPATSVPPITTLSLQDDPPASVRLASFIEDPPIGSVSTTTLQQMDVDDSGEGLMKVLEGMTLEVMNTALQDCAASLRANIAQLHDENTTATEQLKTLEARITIQDATLLELQGLQAEVMVLQDQVKILREESTTRDQQLQCAQDQLGHQECTTTILQDAYNAIHQCLTRQPQPPSFSFTNTMYLANHMYGSSQSMVLVNMGQIQAMEGMYLNLPSSVGNISTGSMLGGPSAGPSVSTITGSSCTGRDTTSGVASSR